MARPAGLSQWHQTVSTYLPQLSQPQVKGLVLWSVWEQPKRLDPARAERLWLARAAATLGTVSVGCQAEAARPTPQLSRLAAVCTQQALPGGCIVPEPWPHSLDLYVEGALMPAQRAIAACEKTYT